ncbi:MAG: glycoside hydrolase family 31 protein [Lentisphaeria bacterium]|nr:glycoside hydrolase family 31 protein [Lentisphaeria bacterium]
MIETAGPDGRILSLEVLQEGIFHIKVYPARRKNFVPALERYDFLENLEEEKDAVYGEDEDRLSAEIGKEELVLEKKNNSFSLKKSSGETCLALKELRFSPQGTTAVFPAEKGEDWVGFGDVSRERMWARGQSFLCRLRRIENYIGSPFLMSTRGYALLVNTTFSCAFDMAETREKEFSFTDGSGVLDLFLFTGADFKAMLRKYTLLAGRVQMIPVWALGLWNICNNVCNARDVVEEALKYREEKIPCEVLGLEPGWMEKSYDFSTEKQWSKTRFPLMLDAFKFRNRTFIDAVKNGMGYHFELWICNDYDLTYEEEARKGRVHGEDAEAQVDFTEEYGDHLGHIVHFDPHTKDRNEPWFRHLENFVDWGADFFKQDGACQGSSHPDRLYGNGMTDPECHNFYCLMYARQMWEGFRNYTGRRPLVFTPYGWTSFQKWATTWTGDTGGGPSTLCAMLNCAMLGHTLPTNDMSANTPEGIHFGYLLPISQINNFSSCKMPWVWGPKILEMHRFYASFHSRLIPYLYSELWKAANTGIPFLRPLLLEFQKEEACRNVIHEYLLGSHLLVTIYDSLVTFPACRWKDFWTGEVLEGGCRKRISWPENRGGGLFLREGAILPLGPVLQFRSERKADEVELFLFPGREKSSFEYYEDDGISFEYKKGKYSVTVITLEKTASGALLSITPGKETFVRKWAVAVSCDATPEKVLCNGQEIPFVWDGKRKELHAELPGTGTIAIFEEKTEQNTLKEEK